MEHDNNIKKSRGGKHFTYGDRIRLETLVRVLYPKGKGICFTELARRLGKHRTTVAREFRRGTVVNTDTELVRYTTYSAAKGQQEAERAALDKGPVQRITTRIAKHLRHLILDLKLSPYAAVMKMKASGKFRWVPSERTVYYAVDSGLLGISRNQLPYARPAGKRRRSPPRMAYTNAGGRSIDERPEEADSRTGYGHWEMDTVLGGTRKSPVCLLVLTERMTRREIIRKIPGRRQEFVVRALNALERAPDSIFRTMRSLTCDNGCEFLDSRGIERSCLHKKDRCRVYFAHPYSAFERGSNENANRIIRRFIPKGADISKYTNRDIRRIEEWINNLPRKSLDGLSAEEAISLYFERRTA